MPPAAPTAPVAVMVAPTSIVLQWTVAEFGSGGFPVRCHELHYCLAELADTTAANQARIRAPVPPSPHTQTPLVRSDAGGGCVSA